MGKNKSIKLDIVQGVEGKSIYLDDHRIAGTKPWGGGRVLATLDTTLDSILDGLRSSLYKSGVCVTLTVDKRDLLADGSLPLTEAELVNFKETVLKDLTCTGVYCSSKEINAFLLTRHDNDIVKPLHDLTALSWLLSKFNIIKYLEG